MIEQSTTSSLVRTELSVVFTAYRRPLYWDRVLWSWSQVRGITEVPVTVFLEPSDHQESMAALVRYRLPHAQVLVNSRRLGVLTNPHQALSHAFVNDKAQFAVLAEDDVVVSSDILEYFRWASQQWADPFLLGACAFSRQRAHLHSPAEVEALSDFNPLVWGTWSDRWFRDLDKTWDHDYSSGPEPGNQQGWDWNIRLRVLNGRHFLFPRLSRSDHIGKEGGVHMLPQDFSNSTAPTFQQDREVCKFYRATT